jgi:thiol-disulfide isomerase/thioredoxin
MNLIATSSPADDGGAAKPAAAESKSPSANASAQTAIEQHLGVPLKEIEKAYEGRTPPESVRMLLAVARGSNMGAGDGWFGPADSRFSWEWLARKSGVDSTAIPADKFPGPAHWFARLDRNKDGRITPDDMDWSDRNPWIQQSYLVSRLFRRIESNGDGKLTREEWIAFFDKAGSGKDHLVSEELRDALLSGISGGFLPGDAPSQDVLIRGLFAGELGSLNEGPKVNEQAPDFALKTVDGSKTIRLGEVIGKKPVVLTLGNFTCGPFRAMFPGVDDIHKRFGEEAVFLMVYVREAHPTDGWKMESNARLGVAVAQPKTFAERTAVATQCSTLLKPSMPLLVDEINDPVGNAYSGMPARMYVIDLQGKVAYKSGRGPFGFKSGEMEQALVMALLEQQSSPGTEAKVEKANAVSGSGK